MAKNTLNPGDIFNFHINKLDPLGQGVHFHHESAVFIPKTLPGESGTAVVVKKRKGVYFAKLLELTNKSGERQEPECAHFYQGCQACQYLHVSYATELELKKKALQFYLKKWLLKAPIQVTSAPERFHYRSRVQLHYELKKTPPEKLQNSATEFQTFEKLGFFTQDYQILNTPNCLMPCQELTPLWQDLFAHEKKDHILPKLLPQQGHVELCYQPQLPEHNTCSTHNSTEATLSLAWNQNYAHKGFQQINHQMNQKLRQLVHQILKKPSAPCLLLDLFCGQGNLSSSLQNTYHVIGIDSFVASSGQHPLTHFLPLDLYQAKVLNRLHQIIISKPYQEKILILNPPRSGWAYLAELLTSTINSQPPWNQLVYISCFPATLQRDLELLNAKFPWQKMNIFLLDLFPGTQHFETVVNIEW